MSALVIGFFNHLVSALPICHITATFQAIVKAAKAKTKVVNDTLRDTESIHDPDSNKARSAVRRVTNPPRTRPLAFTQRINSLAAPE